MKVTDILFLVTFMLLLCCSPQKEQEYLSSWNDTTVKEKLMNFINVDVEKIPVEDRIAVFDMDGTLISELPLCAEFVVSIHRILELGEKDTSIKESEEYKAAKKLSVNPRDTSVWNHRAIFGKLSKKAFVGMDSEELVRFANNCLNTVKNPDYNVNYADMYYKPMLELVELLKQKQFQIYVVSGSMQEIVWSICPQIIGVNRQNLLGVRYRKKVYFSESRRVSYIIEGETLSPINAGFGKTLNIYDHIGKTPVLAVGNSYSDFGMFHMASSSKYPNLSMMLNHDDAEREYVHETVEQQHLQDSIWLNNWLQVDMSKDFKVIWREK